MTTSTTRTEAPAEVVAVITCPKCGQDEEVAGLLGELAAIDHPTANDRFRSNMVLSAPQPPHEL